MIILCFSFLLGNLGVKALPANSIENQQISIESEYPYRWGGVEVASLASTNISDNPRIVIDSRMYGFLVWDELTDFGSSDADRDIVYALYRPDYITAFHTSAKGVISTESDGDSNSPSIVMDSEDTLHIVWQDLSDYLGAGGSDWDIFYKKHYANGTWTTTEVLSTESTLSSMDAEIAVDSKDNLHIVYRDFTNYLASGNDLDIFYKMWNQTTETWSAAEIVSTESTADSTNPDIAIDSYDNIHVVWQDSTNLACGSDWDVFYKSKDFETQSWTTTKVVSEASTGNSGNPSIAIDGHNGVQIVWEDYTDYAGSGTDSDIFHRSYNAWLDWSVTKVVSTESTAASERPELIKDKLMWTSDDNQNLLHIVWRDATNIDLTSTSDFDIFYKSYRFYSLYDELQNSWSDTEVVSLGCDYFPSIYPSLTQDELGNVYIVWADDFPYAGSGSDRDILFRPLHVPKPTLVLELVSPSYTSDGLVNLTWKEIPYILNYMVWRNTVHFWDYESPATREISVVGAATSFIEILPSPGTYYYRLRAQMKNIDVLDFSNLITVTFTAAPVMNEYIIPFGLVGFAAISALIAYLIFKRKRT